MKFDSVGIVSKRCPGPGRSRIWRSMVCGQREMGRPCEEVVVISDHEEGEITDSDFEPCSLMPMPMPTPTPVNTPVNNPATKRTATTSRTSENGLIQPQKQKHIPREETRWRPPLKRIGRNANFIRDGRTPARHLRGRTVAASKPKLKNVYNYKSSTSESEISEKIPIEKKLSKLVPSKKCNGTSLKMRLSNMLKYSNIVKKTKRKKKESGPSKVSKNANLQNDLENLTSDDAFSEISDLENIDEKPVINGDVSDDDPDLLRELALQSKTERLTKVTAMEKYEKSKSDNDPESPEIDDEINELRMAALKSAMLKKALKRKRITKDQKRKRERLPSSLSNLELEFEDDIVNATLVNELSSENVDYSSYMYNVSDPSFLEVNCDVDIPKVENNLDVKINDDDPDENEDLLRLSLLASMKNHQKPPDIELQSSSSNNKELDSSLLLKLESDSESDCEATKNLAVLHKTLTEQSDFQRNLDLYLKGARQQVSVTSSFNCSITLNNTNQEIKNCNALTGQMPPNVKVLTKSDQQEYQRLLLRIHELEKSKQLSSLSKKSFNSTSSGAQNVNGVRRDIKQVLKPSILINRNASHFWQRLPGINIDRSCKVFENQLAFIRKQIINFSEVMEKQKNDMNNLQIKRNLLACQLKNITAMLNMTDKTIAASRRTKLKTSLKLIKLQRQQTILLRSQNRFSKNVQRKSSENVPPQPLSKVPENNKAPFVSVNDNNPNDSPRTEINVLNNLKISIKGVDDGKRSVHVEPTLIVTPNEHSNSIKSPENPFIGIDKNIILNSNDTVPNSNLDSLKNGSADFAENTTQYMEYHSSLVGLKSNQSWNHDPQAIMCPYDVGGCCKDPSCTYAHLKV